MHFVTLVLSVSGCRWWLVVTYYLTLIYHSFIIYVCVLHYFLSYDITPRKNKYNAIIFVVQMLHVVRKASKLWGWESSRKKHLLWTVMWMRCQKQVGFCGPTIQAEASFPFKEQRCITKEEFRLYILFRIQLTLSL